MKERRIRSFWPLLCVGALALALLAGCGWQKFPEDRTIDSTPPDPPTNLVAVGGDQQVDLTWTASTSYDAVEYYVFIKLDADPDFGAPIMVGNVTAVLIVGLPNGETFRVRVQAMDASGNLSEPADAAEASFTTQPDPPTNITIVTVYQSNALALSISWTGSSSPTLQRYNLYASTDAGVTWSLPIDVLLNTSYVLTDYTISTTVYTIQPGTVYDIAVESVGAGGLVSNTLVGQTQTPPAPPTSFSGIGGDQQVTLFWVASTSTTVVGYTVYISSNNGVTWDAGQDVGNVLTVDITQDAAMNPLQNGQNYLFRGVARDNLGQESLPADAAQVTLQPTDVPQPPPNPVQNLQAVAGNQLIDVFWVPPLPGSGGPVSHFEVSWNDTGSMTVFPNSVSVSPNTATSYQIPNLNNGTQYTIRVRSVGASMSTPEYAWATPGAPNVIISFSDPGGPYRYTGVTSTLPDLVLSGLEDFLNPGTGVVYYTLDGSNPVISASVKTPDATGVIDVLPPFSSTGTFIQANSPTGIAIPLDLDQFGAAGNDFVQVRALFDPDGTLIQTSGNGNEGITIVVTYFIFNATADSFIPFGGMVESRRHQTATLLSNGSVLLIGGRSQSGNVNQNSEMFNKNIEFFANHASPTTPRTEHVAVTLDDANGTVLLIGGRRQIAIGVPVNFSSDLAQDGGGQFAVEVYDPTTQTFTGVTGGVVAEPRVLHQALRLTERFNDNRVLISGGVINPGAQASGTATINSSPTTIAVPNAQIPPTAVSVGDIVVMTGGDTANESQIVFGVSFNSTTFETLIHLTNALSTEPDNDTFSIYRPTYGGCQFYDRQAGTFSNAPTLPDDRFGHRTSLLQDGRILLTGGYFPPHVPSSDIEKTILLFDPTANAGAGSWDRCGHGSAGHHNNSAKLQENRYYHTSTVLMDGKVLITGGIDDGTGYFTGSTGEGNYYADTVLRSCDLADVVGRNYDNITTQATGDMKRPRFFHTATRLGDGRVLITGGIDYLTSCGDPDATATAEIYDPATGTFSYTGTMLEPRYGHVATLLQDGRILITGGRGDYLPEIYDPATSTFYATAGTMTGNHRYHSASLRLGDGRLLITGGQLPNRLNRQLDQIVAGAMIATAEILDPKSSLFAVLATPLAEPRSKHTMTLLDDGRVLIAGGEGGTGTPPVALSSTDIFDPTTETIAPGPTMSTRYGHTALKLRTARLWTQGTATFDGTTTVAGTGTSWQTVAAIQQGDRIHLNSDGNGAYFEIDSVVSDTQLTILINAGFGLPTPGSVASPITGAYTIRMERPYTAGQAAFTYNSQTVTGTGTQWDLFLSADDVIRPAATSGFYVIQSVDSATQVTLARAYLDRSSAAPEAYVAQGNSKILILGGGASGIPLSTGEIFNPATGGFEACTNTMGLARYQHTATLLPNGWVLIVGGNNNFDRTAGLFDPASKRFKPIILPVLGTAVTFAARNNHSAQAMSDGNVLITGGEIAQNVAEIFFPDSDSDPTADADGDGIAGLDLNATSFRRITDTMNTGRVEHSLVYVPGATERVLLVGGTSLNARTTGQLMTWSTADPVGLTDFVAPAITLARSPMQAHTSVLMQGNGNVVIMRGHTVQMFFTK